MTMDVVMVELMVPACDTCCADMSRLDLSLLIAMSHLDHINDSPFNFEMVFEEYSRFGKSEHSQMQMFPKAVALKVRCVWALGRSSTLTPGFNPDV